ncbi:MULTISPECIES: S9 family peptidase [Tatumella]|uniref:S9 family peptidase n=1 Tax=Tatumella punctata TaxID=399969 RepID=A0ABW1VLF3_9GAMM|nr:MULTISPECIES: prolyl oligopeptidase family serine peptidase [unclassified Tatumella]MBS0855393.1 prolyl oligopeptidase family serine peptidase [Tatumella sp. JGM16]MBS0911627.1 prolyl oligopeptidase family serine peptidase [Tatumella sp. JGM91]
MTIPKAAKHPHTMTLHGETRTDNYYWLRDDERSRPEVLDYLRQENDYCQQQLSAVKDLEKRLYQEMVARIPPKDHSVPYLKNGFLYQQRFAAGGEYPAWFRARQNGSADPQWECLIDCNKRAEQHPYYSLGALDITTDNRLMAVAEDFLSRRQYEIRLYSLADNHWFPEVLTGVSPSLVWANDGRTLFYVRQDPDTLLPWQVWRHIAGTAVDQDQLVYQENDDSFYVSLGKTTSEDFIEIIIDSTTSTEVWLVNASEPQSAPECFLPRREDHEYDLDHYQQQFYIRSNAEGINFGLYRTAESLPEERHWQTVIPVREQRVLEDFQVFRDWLVTEERENGLSCLSQYHRFRDEQRLIRFDDPTYVTWLGYNPSPDTSELRYGYSSMTTPATTFQLDLDSGERQILKQSTVKGFSAGKYHSEYLWLTMDDGCEVPVSLVYRKDLFRPAENPLLVYGYGAYGSSMDADFSSSRLSLLDRGFVYALVHIRGGGELGQAWYDGGRLANKQHSFSDFIQSTRQLLARGYGNPQQCYAMGGSAGGLLMGAIVNQAAGLYHGIVAQVPFVDVLTTMLDESIPLTTGEYDEWGNPQQAESYAVIRSYSPYDNVRPAAYPHMLVTTGLHDSQVQYWEPAKWVAKLRELKTDNHLLLLWTDMDAGHGGKSGRFKAYHDIAMESAFLIGLAEGLLPPAQIQG